VVLQAYRDVLNAGAYLLSAEAPALHGIYCESVLILTKSFVVLSDNYFAALNAFDYVVAANALYTVVVVTALRAPIGSTQARSQLTGSRGWQPNSPGPERHSWNSSG